MLLATIIEQNRQLRAKVVKQERQLKAMHYPQIYLLNMIVWIGVGLLLGSLIFGGR